MPPGDCNHKTSPNQSQLVINCEWDMPVDVNKRQGNVWWSWWWPLQYFPFHHVLLLFLPTAPDLSLTFGVFCPIISDCTEKNVLQ